MGRTYPPGPNVTGRDGRQWLFYEQVRVLVQSSFLGRAIDLPIDWEHATQHQASKGESAPAVRCQTNRQNSLLLTEHTVPIILQVGAKSDACLQLQAAETGAYGRT